MYRHVHRHVHRQKSRGMSTAAEGATLCTDMCSTDGRVQHRCVQQTCAAQTCAAQTFSAQTCAGMSMDMCAGMCMKVRIVNPKPRKICDRSKVTMQIWAYVWDDRPDFFIQPRQNIQKRTHFSSCFELPDLPGMTLTLCANMA